MKPRVLTQKNLKMNTNSDNGTTDDPKKEFGEEVYTVPSAEPNLSIGLKAAIAAYRNTEIIERIQRALDASNDPDSPKTGHTKFMSELKEELIKLLEEMMHTAQQHDDLLREASWLIAALDIAAMREDTSNSIRFNSVAKLKETLGKED